MPSGARHALAALIACTAALSVTGSAVAAAVTPFPGASYRVGTKFAGACSEDQATYGYDGLSSQFQSNADSYGHTVGWNRGATGIWMGPGPGPLLSLIHISEPTRPYSLSYAAFCLKKKN